MKRSLRLLLSVIFIVVFLIAGYGVWFFLHLPVPGIPVVTSFMRNQGRMVPPSFVPLEEISPLALCSSIKAEDRIFFDHGGFDWEQLALTVSRFLKEGFRLGGSTISQQLARNLFLDSSPAWSRKAQEALITVVLEGRFSKKEILEFYLNHIEFGPGIFGIGEASEYYFSRKSRALTSSQALFLSSLVAAPGSAWEGKNLERMKSVYQRVARQLGRSGLLDSQDLQDLLHRFDLFYLRTSQGDATAVEVFSAPAVNSPSSALHYFMTSRSIEQLERCGLTQERANTQFQKAVTHAEGGLSDSPVKLMRDLLLSQSPAYLGSSVDGRFELFRRVRPASFELTILDRQSGSRQDLVESPSTQFAATWHPRLPRLVYARRAALREYELIVWDVLERTQTVIERYAAERPPGIRWSPNGEFISYTIEPSYSQPRELKVIPAAGGEGALVGKLSRQGNFDWSPDSSALILVSAGAPGSVMRVSPAGEVQGSFPVVAGECFTAHWGIRQERVLMSCRPESEEYVSIYEVLLESSTARRLASAEGDLLYPIWHPHHSGFFFHARTGTGLRVWMKESSDSDALPIGPETGFNIINRFSPDRQSVMLSSSLDALPPQMLEISLQDLSSRTAYRSSVMPALRPVNIRSVRLTAPDGLAFEAFHWPASTGGQGRKRGVLFLHGGPDVHVMPLWNAGHQFLAATGVDVLAPNFRGSSGYGYSFERRSGTHDQRIQDVQTAWRYMTEDLGIAPEQIVLVGQSYGAYLGADVLRADSKGFGALALLSPSLPSSAARSGVIEFGGPISIFRGMQDLIDEARVRKQLQLRFGDLPLWHLFPQEGHIFSTVDGVASIYGEISLLSRSRS